ncbi:tubulin epsilon and delta complex protein 2 isoform X1 [Polypterus senegalus]|uniref:tubulin epsilon and delta complex protein 2 isoform X1 n=1 Tax=Polypterus senegalus TaxID=55291 RepID=UPI00196239FF|nr:tubulin epsilon and delta complex protein 2 isoform X1 [Polypterus senegalus]XP_039630632.1 tubulin epsilon and delta complex protein 2 isoform X1 [Polypterus senegalus]
MHPTDRSVRVLQYAIEQCKREELRLQESIRQCRKLLQPRPADFQNTQKEEPHPVIQKEPTVRSEEQKDLEVLEKILEKANRIRSTVAHLEPSVYAKFNSEKGNCDKGSNQQVSSNPKSRVDITLGGKKISSSTVAPKYLARDSKSLRPASSRHLSSCKDKNVRRDSPSALQKGVKPAASHKTPGLTTKLSNEANVINEQQQNFRKNECHPEDRKANIESGQERQVIPLHDEWKSLRLPLAWTKRHQKHSRLSEKVSSFLSRPVPERTQFILKMQEMFPTNGPSDCPMPLKRDFVESTDQMHCPESRLKPECRVTEMHDFNGAARLPGKMAAVLHYSSLKELKEMETLKLRVAMLQQQINIQTIMAEDILSNLLSVISPGKPLPVVTRGLYSLLAEGGLHFPSLILDVVSD